MVVSLMSGIMRREHVPRQHDVHPCTPRAPSPQCAEPRRQSAVQVLARRPHLPLVAGVWSLLPEASVHTCHSRPDPWLIAKRPQGGRPRQPPSPPQQTRQFRHAAINAGIHLLEYAFRPTPRVPDGPARDIVRIQIPENDHVTQWPSRQRCHQATLLRVHHDEQGGFSKRARVHELRAVWRQVDPPAGCSSHALRRRWTPGADEAGRARGDAFTRNTRPECVFRVRAPANVALADELNRARSVQPGEKTPCSRAANGVE